MIPYEWDQLGRDVDFGHCPFKFLVRTDYDHAFMSGTIKVCLRTDADANTRTLRLGFRVEKSETFANWQIEDMTVEDGRRVVRSICLEMLKHELDEWLMFNGVRNDPHANDPERRKKAA